MQPDLRTNSMENDFVSGRMPSTAHKWLAAGIATIGAFAIAANPVAPTLPDVREATEAAVSLTAADDPLAVWQESIAETITNLQYLAINAANSSEALGEAVTEADLLGDITNLLVANATNPVPLVTALLGLASYSDAVQNAWFAVDDPTTTAYESGAVERLQTAFQQLLGPVLADMLTYNTPTELPPGQAPNPRTDEVSGVFTQPLFEFNYWFVENFLGAFRTVTPLNDLPAQLIASLPGGAESNIPGLITSVSESGFAKAAFAPVTAAFQATAVLDAAVEALAAGDQETAVRELVNLPAKVTNAFINGYQPAFSPAGEWPGLIDGATAEGGRNQAPGLLEYVLVTFPNEITKVLGGTPPVLEEPETTTTTVARSGQQQQVSSTAITPADKTVNLNLGSGSSPKTKAKGTETNRQTNVVSRIADRVQGNIAKATGAATGGKHAADTESATDAKDRVTVRDLVSRLGIDKKPTKSGGDTGTDNEKKDAPKSEDSSTS